MPTKGHKPEEIVVKLRQVDVLTSQGRSVANAIRSIGVTEVARCIGDGLPPNDISGIASPSERGDIGCVRLDSVAVPRRDSVGSAALDQLLSQVQGFARADTAMATPKFVSA